jgi:hypothetical protein
MTEEEYLYRGTTPGWPGTEGIQQARVTPTTTDPLVATLFAIESRNHGRGIILVGLRRSFEGLIGKPNYFAIVECAVNVMLPPVEFAGRVVREVDIERSIEILTGMGYRLPVRIAKGALLSILNDTHSASDRLNLEQIRHYNRCIFEETQ